MKYASYLAGLSFLALIVLGGAAPAYASYSYSQVGENNSLGYATCGGTDVSGGTGTSVDAGYLNDHPLGPPTPDGFLDAPTHFCFNDSEKWRCSPIPPYGCDTFNVYGWEKFNDDFAPGTGQSDWGQNCGSVQGKKNACQSTAFTVLPGPLPDLVAETPTAQNIALGGSEAFQAYIDNIGSANATTSFNNVFEISSTSSTFSSGYNKLVAGTVIQPPLAPNAQAKTGIVTWAPGYATTYYVRACADYNTSWQGSIGESSENNNCGPTRSFTVSAAKPLYICGKNDGTGTITGTTGVPLNIPVQGSTNNGDNVRYAVNFDGTMSTTSGNVSWLPSISDSYTSGTSANATYTWNTHGTYTIEGVNEDAVTGLYSTWTACKVTITDGVGPDLSPQNLVPNGTTVNVATPFTGTLLNSGTADTGSFSSTVYICLQGDSTCEQQFQNLHFSMRSPSILDRVFALLVTRVEAAALSTMGLTGNPIPAHSTGTQKGTYTFTTAGTYEMNLCADLPANQVAELDETNNCGGWQTVVVCPSGQSWNGTECVSPPPTLTCTVTTPMPVNGGDPVQMSASATGFTGTLTYIWRTDGGGSCGNSSSCQATYQNAGTYNPEVEVRDTGGNDITQSCSPTVTVLPVCSVQPPSGTVPQQVTWTATHGGGSYAWYDALGNSLGSGATYQQTYDTAGDYGAYVVSNGQKSTTCISSLQACDTSPSGLLSASPTRVATGSAATLTWSNVMHVPAQSECYIIPTPNTGSIDVGQTSAACDFSGGSKPSNAVNTQTLFQLVCGGKTVTGASTVVDVSPNINEF